MASTIDASVETVFAQALEVPGTPVASDEPDVADEPDAVTLAPFADDALPPEASYESKQDALDGVNGWAKVNGGAYRIARSRQDANGRTRAIFECVRAGAPPAKRLAAQRQTSSVRCHCQCSLRVTELQDGRWEVRHRGGDFDKHNHPVTRIASAFAQHRPLSDSMRDRIWDQSQSGVPPRKIIAMLRAESSEALNVTSKDVYNVIESHKRQQKAGGTSIAYAKRRLLQDGAHVRTREDASDPVRVVDLFWAFPQFLYYFGLYPNILIIDCTYKTNHARLPLFEMVGVDAAEKTFCVAFAFLSAEDTESFVWAFDQLKVALRTKGISQLPQIVAIDRALASINAITASFPLARPIICLWHANKAVAGHCKPDLYNDGEETWESFEAGWLGLIDSSSEAEFDSKWSTMRSTFGPKFGKHINYLWNTWLVYRQFFVRAWIDKSPHFGIRTTGRVESTHGLIKKHLPSTELTLEHIIQHIRVVVDNQLHNLSQVQGVQQSRILSEAPDVIFGALNNFVSHEAIRHILGQLSVVDPPPCTGLYRRSMGLPCTHELRGRPERMIRLSEVHEQWRLKYAGNTTALLDPLVMKERRAHEQQLKRQTTSTGRILTTAQAQELAFEHSQALKKRERKEKEKKEQQQQSKKQQQDEKQTDKKNQKMMHESRRCRRSYRTSRVWPEATSGSSP